jgi:hypothetical protein
MPSATPAPDDSLKDRGFPAGTASDASTSVPDSGARPPAANSAMQPPGGNRETAPPADLSVDQSPNKSTGQKPNPRPDTSRPSFKDYKESPGKFVHEDLHQVLKDLNAFGNNKRSIEIQFTAFSQMEELPFENATVEYWRLRVTEKRLLILRSDASPVLRAAAGRIARTIGVESNIRSVRFGYQPDKSPTLRDLVEAVRGEKLTGGLVVLHAYVDVPRGFFDSLPEDDYPYTEDLRGCNTSLLILAGRHLRTHPAGSYDYIRLEPEVDWERPLIDSRSDVSAELAAKLRSLRAAGRWPETFQETRSLLDEGRFERLVLERSSSSGSVAAVPPLLSDADTLDNAVRFVTCYFSQPENDETVSTSDFARVLQTVLGVSSVEEHVAFTKEDGTTTTKSVSRPLIEVWRASPQKIATRCGISPRKNSLGATYLDFTEPGARRRVAEEFRISHVWTFEDFAQRVEASGLLFDNSPAVRAGAVKVLLERMQSDPRGYGRSCLVQITKDQPRPLALRIHFGLAHLIDGMVSAGMTDAVYDVLSYLLGSGDFVDAWIASLQVKGVPEFRDNFLKLLRRVFDADLPDLKRLVELYLMNLASNAGTADLPLIAAVLSWTADSATPRQPSTEAATRLALELISSIPFSKEVARLMGSAPENEAICGHLVRLLFSEKLEEKIAPFLAQNPMLASALTTLWLVNTPDEEPLPDAIRYLRERLYIFFGSAIEGEGMSTAAGMFRAVAMVEWLAAVPAGKGLGEDLLEKFNKASRAAKCGGCQPRDLKRFIQLLMDGAADCANEISFIPWEGTDRAHRKRLVERLRQLRETARTAKAALFRGDENSAQQSSTQQRSAD